MLLGAAVAGLAQATFEMDLTRRSPITEAGGVSPDGDSLCLWKNDDDRACFEMTPDIAKVGWFWTQEFESTPSTDPPQRKYYDMRWHPTARGKGNAQFTLFIKNLVALVVEGDLAEFDASIILAMIFVSDYKVCFGVGYEVEQIDFTVKVSLQLWNYAMTILEDLLDFSSTWSGAEARYLDEIQASNNKDILFYD